MCLSVSFLSLCFIFSPLSHFSLYLLSIFLFYFPPFLLPSHSLFPSLPSYLTLSLLPSLPSSLTLSLFIFTLFPSSHTTRSIHLPLFLATHQHPFLSRQSPSPAENPFLARIYQALSPWLPAALRPPRCYADEHDHALYPPENFSQDKWNCPPGGGFGNYLGEAARGGNSGRARVMTWMCWRLESLAALASSQVKPSCVEPSGDTDFFFPIKLLHFTRNMWLGTYLYSSWR